MKIETTDDKQDVPSIRIGRSHDKVLIENYGDLPWQEALELARKILRAAHALKDDERVRIDGVGILEKQAGYMFGKAIYQQAVACREWVNAVKTINDQAIMLRTGAPVGLTDCPKINEEALKSAQWDTNIRRYIPSSIKSKEKLGVPTIIQGAPPNEIN